MTVSGGGTADDVTVYGMLTVSSGGTATGIREEGGIVIIEDGATVSFASHTFSDKYLYYGSTTLHSGTTALRPFILSRSIVDVFDGGIVENAILGIRNNQYDCGGILRIFSGGTAHDTYVNYRGNMYISGGAASGATVNDYGSMFVCSGGSANENVVQRGGRLYVSEGGAIANTTVADYGSLTICKGGKLTGRMAFERGAVVEAMTGAILDFDLSQIAPESSRALLNDWSVIRSGKAMSCTLTINETPMGSGTSTYLLADGAADFAGTISVMNTAGDTLGVLTVGETVSAGGCDYTLNLNESVLSVTVKASAATPPPENLVGTPEKVSWKAAEADYYIVEYSTDNFEHVIRVVTNGSSVDMPELPAGTYQWRVKADDSEEWAVGESFVSEGENESGTPKVVQSNEDGNDDLFFATPNGTWGNIYYAQHVGSINDWTGTNELISAYGKGRIQNLFFGSTDTNVLCLTDGENGDAIFVDDVYSDSPEDMAKNMARLFKIQEIRAGAGNDIVDMTSQKFEYIGGGLTIRGGEGNDTIWANKGDNWLFGDAGNDRIVGASGNDVIAGGIGNDRMHGGGGNDVFAFCDNWGVDNVEQLAGGSVTLWFAESESQITASELDGNSVFTNADGTASVTVKGFALADIAVKYGDDGLDDYAALAASGAFFDATTERIFEESGKGMLASL